MLPSREASDALAREALRRFGLGETHEAELLQVSENITYLARSRSGAAKDAVLRISRPGYHAEGELAGELAWMRRIRAETPLTVPAALPGTDGSCIQEIPAAPGRPPCSCVLFEFLTGRSPDEDDEEAPRWFRRLGEATARLHNQVKAWEGRPEICRFTWDCESMIGDGGRWGSWKAAPDLTPETAKMLERARAVIEARLAAYGRGKDRFGLIHADLRLSNLLAEGETIKIIDFDDCGYGWFLHDLAAAVSFIETKPAAPRLIEAWLGGYARAGALSREDLSQVDTFVLQRRLQLQAWLASHPGSHAVEELGRGFTQGTAELAQRYLSKYA